MISYNDMCYTSITLLLGVVCGILSKFTIFHLNIIAKNSTTIDTLENKLNFRYSLGTFRNFAQVFGEKWYMWPLPFYGKVGMPAGDGINWRIPVEIPSDTDVNVESEVNRGENTAKNSGMFNNNEKFRQESRGRNPVLSESIEKHSADSETDTSFMRLNHPTS